MDINQLSTITSSPSEDYWGLRATFGFVSDKGAGLHFFITNWVINFIYKRWKYVTSAYLVLTARDLWWLPIDGRLQKVLTHLSMREFIFISLSQWYFTLNVFFIIKQHTYFRRQGLTTNECPTPQSSTWIRH